MRVFRVGCCVAVLSCLLAGCDSGASIKPDPTKNTNNGLDGMPKSNMDINAVKKQGKSHTGMP